jgi:hypothetical protein
MKQNKMYLYDKQVSAGSFTCVSRDSDRIKILLNRKYPQKEIEEVLKQNPHCADMNFYVGQDIEDNTKYIIHEIRLPTDLIWEVFKKVLPPQSYEVPELYFCSDDRVWTEDVQNQDSNHVIGTTWLKYEFDFIIMTGFGISSFGTPDQQRLFTSYMSNTYSAHVSKIILGPEVSTDVAEFFRSIGKLIMTWIGSDIRPSVFEDKIDRLVGGEIEISTFDRKD